MLDAELRGQDAYLFWNCSRITGIALEHPYCDRGAKDIGKQTDDDLLFAFLFIGSSIFLLYKMTINVLVRLAKKGC